MKRVVLVVMAIALASMIITGCESKEVKEAKEVFASEVARIQAELTQRDEVVSAAKTLLDEGKPPLEEEDETTLKDAIETANKIEFEEPEVPKELEEINAETEKLKQITYKEQIEDVEKATADLERSIKKCELVTAPEEDYVIKCLKTVKNVGKIEPVTEDHDPNGMLGKQGGYTAQVYFSSPLVKDPYLSGDVIEDGTDGGGSIEVFTTPEEAKTREEYLAGFDSSGALASGSHKVVGSCLVRTSNNLKASEQKKLEKAIIKALTKLEDE